MRSQQKLVARSTQGWGTPARCSSPTIAAVGRSEPGGSSGVSHQGARGSERTLGSTNGTPASAVAIEARDSQVRPTIGSSRASVSSRIRRAASVPKGWLLTPRRSGSRP